MRCCVSSQPSALKRWWSGAGSNRRPSAFQAGSPVSSETNGSILPAARARRLIGTRTTRVRPAAPLRARNGHGSASGAIGYPPGSVHPYARWRARRRVGSVCPSPVERQHPPHRQADRGHAQAAEVRERLLRSALPGGGHTAHAGWAERRGSIVEPMTDQRPARWQTPRERHLAEQQQFLWLMGREHTPGVPAETAQVALSA